MNDEAVYRTDPATQGLLIIFRAFFCTFHYFLYFLMSGWNAIQHMIVPESMLHIECRLFLDRT